MAKKGFATSIYQYSARYVWASTNQYENIGRATNDFKSWLVYIKPFLLALYQDEIARPIQGEVLYSKEHVDQGHC